MRILALDTCCGLFSIALIEDGKLLYFCEHSEPNQQSSLLLPYIEKGLKQTGLVFSDLTHLAVTIGPGSFTGIRIGLAAAQGIALHLKIPIIGVTTLEALAYKKNGEILVTIEAGRGQYYTQEFREEKPMSNPMLLTQEEIATYTSHQIYGALGDPKTLPEAQSVGFIAWDKISSGEEFTSPLPLYIREPDAVVRPKQANS